MKVLVRMLGMAIGAAVVIALVAWVLMLLLGMLPWEQARLSFTTTYVLLVILIIVREVVTGED